MSDALERIAAARILPVITLPDARRAVELGRALAAGGLPCIEITLRTEGALEAIRRLADSNPDVLVGAGTVRSGEQAHAAVEAGARFLLSADLNPEVVDAAAALGVPHVPGVCTPTEIATAARLGVSTVKFFPAEPSGGAAALRAVAGPFPDARFIPTGGIAPATLAGYLALPNVIACGGSWMAPAAAIAAGEWDEIERLARESARLARPSG